VARRRRISPRKHKGPGSPEVISLVLLIAMLAFVLIFKDSLANSVSAVLGAFESQQEDLSPMGSSATGNDPERSGKPEQK